MQQNEALFIGKVESVRGRIVEVQVNKSKNTSHVLFEGQIIKSVTVGGYVKINKGFDEIIGKIDEEYITEDKLLSAKEYIQERSKIKRILKISLIGYFEKSNFKQGIKELPLIDNEVFLISKDEFNKIHNFIRDINGEPDEVLKIGVLSNQTGVEIAIGVNSLFASHIGIFGNTGSGKSYTLASLYHQLFMKYGESSGFKKNAKFLIIDFNGEYSDNGVITSNKKSFILDTHSENGKDKLPIGQEILMNIELLSILTDATEKTQKPYLKRAIDFYKRVHQNVDPKDYFRNILRKQLISILLVVDKEKAHQLIEYFVFILNEEDSNSLKMKLFEELEWQNKYGYFQSKGVNSQISVSNIHSLNLYTAIEDYELPINSIEIVYHFLYSQIIYDLLNDKAKNEHISPVINKLKSKARDLNKVIDFKSSESIFKHCNIVVVDFKKANLTIKKSIPLLLASQEYSFQKINHKKSNELILNIIIDEAHNVLSYNSMRESETWKDYRLETFEEIIKEGRKFGVFLTIASQRPSDISDTIISQLHNYFLHRLINNRDIQAIERTISYLDKVSFDTLPILPTGTCVLAGLSASVPVIIDVDKIPKENEPNNKTIRPTDFWKNDTTKNTNDIKDNESN